MEEMVFSTRWKKNQDLAEAAVNFRTNGIWDLKGQPGVPPPSHWAIYKGELVADAYLANNAYLANSVLF